jgi:hypothetical protein
VIAFSTIIGLWCLIGARPGSRRLELELDDRELRFRPFLGWRRRIALDSLRQVDERPRRLLRLTHLALRYRRRRRLRIFRWWYGNESFERLRTQLGHAQLAPSTRRAAQPKGGEGAPEQG